MDSSVSGNPAPHVSRRLNDEQVSEDSIVLDSGSDHTLWLDYEATLQEQSQYCKEIESEVEDYWAQVELNTEPPHIDDECSLRTGCLPDYHEICFHARQLQSRPGDRELKSTWYLTADGTPEPAEL